MDQRLTFVTLIVADLAASREFYVAGLGWEPVDVGGAEEVLMLRVADRVILSLWSREAAVAEVGAVTLDGAAPLTLAHNVGSVAQVDEVLTTAAAAGASILAPGQQRHWGGYSGYFADPNGFRWEIAYLPGDFGDTLLPG